MPFEQQIKFWRTVEFWAETFSLNISIVLTTSCTHLLDITYVFMYVSLTVFAFLCYLLLYWKFSVWNYVIFGCVFFHLVVVSCVCVCSHFLSLCVCAAVNWISDKLSFTAAATAVRLLALNVSLRISFFFSCSFSECVFFYSWHVLYSGTVQYGVCYKSVYILFLFILSLLLLWVWQS